MSPAISAFAESVLPNHVTVIVASFESITITVGLSPAGKVGIVPTQVPAKRFCFAATVFCGSVFGDANVFGFDVFAAGVVVVIATFGFRAGVGEGVSISRIGAGDR